jgi:hypothetical protein
VPWRRALPHGLHGQVRPREKEDLVTKSLDEIADDVRKELQSKFDRSKIDCYEIRVAGSLIRIGGRDHTLQIECQGDNAFHLKSVPDVQGRVTPPITLPQAPVNKAKLITHAIDWTRLNHR